MIERPEDAARRLPQRRYTFRMNRRYQMRVRGTTIDRDDYAGWAVQDNGRIIHKWGTGAARIEVPDEIIEYTVELQ